jgi:hypothetical protein
MRAIVSIITAAAFLLHFAAGCCAHHAHAADSLAVVKTAAKACKHCHHHESPAESSPGNSDEPGQPCDEGECVFMTASKIVVARLACTSLLPLVANDAGDAHFPGLASAAIDSGGTLEPPVRLHLLKRVLLI